MKRVIRKIVHGLTRIANRYSFLLRLLSTSLFAALIPLMLVNVKQIEFESNYIDHNTHAQIDSVAASAASRIDDCIESMVRIRYKLVLEPKLFESALATGSKAQIEGLKVLENYAAALPFSKDFGLYSIKLCECYALSGKYQTNGMAMRYMNTNESTFLELLASLGNNPSFVRCNDEDSFLYIIPIRIGVAREVSMYALFQITSLTLREYIGSIMPYGAQISMMSEDGNVFFGTPTTETEMLLVASSTSTHGIQVQVAMPQIGLQQTVNAITNRAWLLSILSICLCVILILVVVFFNYHPLAQLVKHISTSEREESELNAIMNRYAQLSAEKGTLTEKLYESKLLAIDRIIENLLNGRKVPPEDFQLLKLNMPCYRVVCAPLGQIENVSDIISHNSIDSPIYAIEMYADDQLVFICGQPSDSESAFEILVSTLRKLVKSDTLPLGFSTICTVPERLFISYFEAMRALHTSSTSSNYIGVAFDGQGTRLLNVSQQELYTLTQSIANGDEQMLTFAKHIFDEIASQLPSRSFQRFICYQLIDLYSRLAESIGYSFDTKQVSQIFQENSTMMLRERFFSLLSDFQQQRQHAKQESDAHVHDDVIQFIGEHYTDSAFSMNDIAEHLGVSIYAASRILKTYTNVNFRQYINSMRLDYACDLLLTTELSISDISLQVGFSSASYFNTIFKKEKGTTPTDYRKSKGNQL